MAAWIESRRANRIPDPSAADRGRVAAEAKRLLGEDVPLAELVEAATAMGAGAWADLRKQVSIGRSKPPNGVRRPPPGVSHLDEWIYRDG